jgi:sarcosine oxidase subunit beta
MRISHDAIIIGAGVIGTAIGLELARRGLRTLNVDRHPAAGYGSTSSSCAIIRCFYSTVAASAFALEGYHYWKNWKEYLGVDDERGLARFRETGCLILKTEANGKLEALVRRMQEAGVSYEEWSCGTIVACENGLDHDRKPMTFRGRHTGHRFDAGFFSRLRTINRSSSFSVLG